GRRVTFSTIIDGEIGWTSDPDRASLFEDEKLAEFYKDVHKKSFNYDDRVMERRQYDGVHCRFCYCPTPSMRRVGVECNQELVRVEHQCSHCNQFETAVYEFRIVVQ